MIDYIKQGDCLELMKNIPDKSIDMILCDLPYGTTACKWDKIIPLKKHIVINDKVVYEDEYILTEFKKSNKSYGYLRDEFNTKAKDGLWEQYERVVKDNGAIVLFGSEPFSTELRHSNLKMYKYDWIWDKKIPVGMSYARFQPMRQTENISVFCKSKTVYNPQMVKRDKAIKKGGNKYSPTSPIQACKKGQEFQKTYEYKNPVNLLTFDRIRRGTVHPTQKPLDLLEYLIKTYTNENEIILDNCFGSGSTCVACVNTNRHYIGFELEQNYFDIAKQRIEDAKNKIKEGKQC